MLLNHFFNNFAPFIVKKTLIRPDSLIQLNDNTE